MADKTNQAQAYNCISCGAPLHFDPASGKLKCDYCDSLYTPEEIEEHLDRSPLIRESIVYESDDQLAADIVVETAEEEFTDIESLEKTWLSRIREEADRINKELPPYKRVSKVSLRLDPLPRNALGKVIRKETR